MKRIAIIQARTGSTRLPGKVLACLGGRPMLAQIIRRLRSCHRIDGIVVATSDRVEDSPVAKVAQTEGVQCFRGSETDVLSRYTGAAREANADIVIRITADCPLLDPGTVDLVVETLEGGQSDYASNVIERTYPRGLDVEAFFRDVLERMDRLARSPQAREHVTWFLVRERPELFVREAVLHPRDHSHLRWTVDTAEDLAFAKCLYDALQLGERVLPYEKTLAYVQAHPEITAINADVQQKSQ